MKIIPFLSEKLFKSQRYQSLSTDESQSDSSELGLEDEKLQKHAVLRLHRLSVISILLGLTIFITTILGVILFNSKRISHWDQCGTTPEQARSRGCIFEMTLSLWVPEECYDRELEEEYLRSENLVYYRDIHLTEVAPLDEVKLGQQYGWFVPMQHHLRHCEFGLRKFHRGVINGGKIDGYLLSYNHTMHCLKMFTEAPEMASKLPQRDVHMFPYCGRRGGYNVDKTQSLAWSN